MRRLVIRRLTLLIVLLSLVPLSLAQAVEATVSLQYGGGEPVQFAHTTVPAAACTLMPAFCRNVTTFSAPLSYTKLTIVSRNEPRDEFYGTLPGPRSARLVHEQTGEQQHVELTFTRLGQRVASPDRAKNPATGISRVSGTCNIQPGVWASNNEYITRWYFTRAPGTCATRPRVSAYGQQQTVEVSELNLAYTVTLPPPYRFRSGRYTATLRYTLGVGGDFDFGDRVSSLSDNELVVNLVVDVQHGFRVEFGANFEHAVLEPPGGWSSWLDGGRVPPRIYSDQSLRLWSSGPFRVYKLCEFDAGDRCAIRNRRGEDVPVEVRVTMPWGIRQGGWQGINRVPVPTGSSAALELESIVYTSNGPGQVHFEVVEADLRPMLERAGERYSGKVTLMFDAEL